MTVFKNIKINYKIIKIFYKNNLLANCDYEIKLDNVIKFAELLTFTEEKSKLIETSFAELDTVKFLAVRSSSPEEDLEGASFAGGYKTVLGATKDNLKDSILSAFISCLDKRVFAYKKNKGNYHCEFQFKKKKILFFIILKINFN